MAQLVIQMPSNDRLNLLKELVTQLGGTVEKVVSRAKAKEKPFVELSASALNKRRKTPIGTACWRKCQPYSLSR